MKDVVNYIKDQIDTCIEVDSTPVFTQKATSDMYNKCLVRHSADEEFTKRTHCTHLWERIMEEVPGLRESRDGRNVVLRVDDDVGRAIFEACENSKEDEIIILSKASKLIRKHLLQLDDMTFNGVSTTRRQNESVPDYLTKLISMILEGGSMDRELSPNLKKISANIVQLIRFNTVKQTRNKNLIHFLHSTKNEPPLPVVSALMLHAATRKGKLVDWCSEEGMCVSYDRLLDIRDTIGEEICKEYDNNDLVCPPLLEEGAFVTAAIDNLDHNPSSVDADTSVHVMTISIFQHVTNLPALEQKTFDLKPRKTVRKMNLPKNYTDIKPTRESKPEPPTVNVSSSNSIPVSLKENASSWLSKLPDVPNDESISFSAFYSHQQCDETPVVKTSTHLLPINPVLVQSPATVRHCTNQVKRITERLNPGQPAVITAASLFML